MPVGGDLPQVFSAARWDVFHMQGIGVSGGVRLLAIQRKRRDAPPRGAHQAHSVTSRTHMTSQAPGPVSVRSIDVLIQAPSSRTPSTRSPVNVTISPRRKRDNCRAMREFSGMTCVLALCAIIASLDIGASAEVRQK